MRVLGIDPGSVITGYGLVEIDGHAPPSYLASDRIPVQGEDLPQRLGCIYRAVSEVVRSHRPDVMAIERVFVHRNVDAALKLGQARGAAICAAVAAELEVAEYAPRAIKLAVVGHGGAEKRQVQHMVAQLLRLGAALQADEADALAVAICHGHSLQVARVHPLLAAAQGRRRRR